MPVRRRPKSRRAAAALRRRDHHHRPDAVALGAAAGRNPCAADQAEFRLRRPGGAGRSRGDGLVDGRPTASRRWRPSCGSRASPMSGTPRSRAQEVRQAGVDLCRSGVRGLVRARLRGRGASRAQDDRRAQGALAGLCRRRPKAAVHLLPAGLGLRGGQPQSAARPTGSTRSVRRGRAGQPLRARPADRRGR